MPGPSTNISNQSPQLMAGQSCAGDMVDKLRSFGANGCLEVVVPDGRTSILTAINLGASVVTIEQILTDKCDVFYYVPYAPHDCAVKLSAATTMQPLRVAGRYRLCISPPNPDAKIDENSVEQNGASCCAVDVKCQPVAAAAPVVSAVTGIPCPLTAPFSWLGSTYTTLAQFIADVKAQVAGATYNAATCTFTAPTGSVFPSLVVAPVVAALEYCASGRLPDGGFMYVVGDAIDPAATVAVTDCAVPPTVVGYIYPSARPTATTQVLACGVGSAVGPLLGYAANRSKCAAECPCPTSAPASTVTPAPPPVVAQKSLCQLTQEAAATVISPSLPTDELFVLRAGECARVTVASIAPAPAPPPVQTQLVANDSPTVNFTQSGADAHTVTADVIIDQAAGNALVATPTGLRVVIPATNETPLTATDSNTIDFTQTAVGSHSFTASVKVDPVAGNLIVAGPNGLSAKVTCPDASVVATKLCPTGEFVGFDPLTCAPTKYSTPKPNPSALSVAVPTTFNLADVSALPPAPASVTELYYDTRGNHAKTNHLIGSAAAFPTAPGIGQSFGPFTHTSGGYIIAHVSWGMSRFNGLLPTYLPGGLGDIATLTYQGSGTAGPTQTLASVEFVENEYFYGDPANDNGAMRHAIYILPITAAGTANLKIDFPNLVDDEKNQRVVVKLIKVNGYQAPTIIEQKEFGTALCGYTGVVCSAANPQVFGTPSSPPASAFYINALVSTYAAGNAIYDPITPNYPNAFIVAQDEVAFSGTLAALRGEISATDSNLNYIGLAEISGASFSNNIASRTRIQSKAGELKGGHGFMLELLPDSGGSFGPPANLGSISNDICASDCDTASFAEWELSGGFVSFAALPSGSSFDIKATIGLISYTIASINSSSVSPAPLSLIAGTIKPAITAGTCKTITANLSAIGTGSAANVNITVDAGFLKLSTIKA